MAVNVINTNQTNNMSRQALLAWVNDLLETDFNKVEELCTGAAYCQLMDILFRGCIQLKRVKFRTNLEYECTMNLRMLQNALVEKKVNHSVPIEQMAKGRYKGNFEFLQWFKKFFDANYDPNQEYDALEARQHMPMGYGPPIPIRPVHRVRNIQ